MDYKKILDVYAENSNKLCKMNINMINTLTGKVDYPFEIYDIRFSDAKLDYFKEKFGEGVYIESISFDIKCPGTKYKIHLSLDFAPADFCIFWDVSGGRIEGRYEIEKDFSVPYATFFAFSDDIAGRINSDIEEISTNPNFWEIYSYCRDRSKKEWYGLI